MTGQPIQTILSVGKIQREQESNLHGDKIK